MPATLHDVTGALRRKAATLSAAAGHLQAAGQYAEATLAKQEAYNCANRADALDAGAPFQNFPSDAVLQQLAAASYALQNAIANSVAVSDLVYAAANLRAILPGNDPTQPI